MSMMSSHFNALQCMPDAFSGLGYWSGLAMDPRAVL